MSITGIAFFVVYLVCIVGSLVSHPMFGVVGYAATYILSPAGQWWNEPFAAFGFRYSFIMGFVLALSMLLHAKKIKMPKGIHSQEVFFYLLVIWIFITRFVGLPLIDAPNVSLKLFKVAIFIFMFTRIVDDLKKYEIFLWTLIVTALYLGYDALYTSTAYYGRIDRGLGGSDFSEGNFLAAHLAMLLPFIGIFFIKRSLKHRILLIITTVLVVNAIILCRSRGTTIAILVGMLSSVFFCKPSWRLKIILILILGAVASFFLVDPGFLDRMFTIKFNFTNVEALDPSTAGRVKAWYAALDMFKDHPLGIGQGNFMHYVGAYNPDIPSKDTHNTYLRNLAELGFPGILLLFAMIFNAFRILIKLNKKAKESAREKDYQLHIYALSVSLVTFLSAGMFITHTYIEELYWLLAMPVLLEHILNNDLEAKSNEDNSLPMSTEQTFS